jgi:hypothetical protein
MGGSAAGRIGLLVRIERTARGVPAADAAAGADEATGRDSLGRCRPLAEG